jgi:hypothetical protein
MLSPQPLVFSGTWLAGLRLATAPIPPSGGHLKTVRGIQKTTHETGPGAHGSACYVHYQ